LTDQRKTLVFLLAISIIVKTALFILGAVGNRAFEIEESPPDLFAFGEVEGFKDYAGGYLPTVRAFKSGYTPYIDFWYAYPPLFLYTLTAFSYLPLGFPGPALPIVMLDAFSAVPLYLIGLRFVSPKKSFVASLLFTLSPINLFYNDFLWLNPPLVTFFALLSTYFVLAGRYELSAVSLAASFGFKQTGLALFPVLLVLVLKRAGWKKALGYVAFFVAVAVAISMPYLATAPQHYLGCVTMFKLPFWPRPETGSEYYQRIWPWWIETNTTQPVATYPVQGNSPVNSAFPVFVLASQGKQGDELFAYFNEFNGKAAVLLDLALLSSFCVLLLKVYRSRDVGDRGAVKYLLLSLILFHSFYERGVFKYYYATVTPFLALFMSSRVRGALFVLFSFFTFLVPRYLSPWILLPFLAYVVLKQPFISLLKRLHRDATADEKP